MARNVDRVCTAPRDDDLDLRLIANAAGLAITVLPTGSLFAIEHQHERSRIMLNQVLGSPLDGGIGRLYLRIGGPEPRIVRIGPGGRGRFGLGGSGPLGAAGDRIVWEGESFGLQHRVTLWLHARSTVWLWHLELANRGAVELPCDAILVQDLGLGGRGFLMNNEAYVSQYIDHHIAADPQLGPVVMSRQNQAQDGRHPWLALGCLDGTAAFATDALQLFGPAYRDADSIRYAPGTDLPSRRVQHEVACPALQSRAVTLKPGASATRTFFGLYEPHHPDASAMPTWRGSTRCRRRGWISRRSRSRSQRRSAASCRTRRRWPPIRWATTRSPAAIPNAATRSAAPARCCRSSRPTVATTAM